MSDKTRAQISNDAAHDTFRLAENEILRLREIVVQQQRTIEELTANRACAWAELNDIRAAISAEEDESTADEVRRRMSTIASQAAQIHQLRDRLYERRHQP